MDKQLEKVLVCPVCKGSLELLSDELVCQGCRLAYPIVAGVPNFIISEARHLVDDSSTANKHVNRNFPNHS